LSVALPGCVGHAEVARQFSLKNRPPPPKLAPCPTGIWKLPSAHPTKDDGTWSFAVQDCPKNAIPQQPDIACHKILLISSRGFVLSSDGWRCLHGSSGFRVSSWELTVWGCSMRKSTFLAFPLGPHSLARSLLLAPFSFRHFGSPIACGGDMD
jgi:hypothetical protein